MRNNNTKGSMLQEVSTPKGLVLKGMPGKVICVKGLTWLGFQIGTFCDGWKIALWVNKFAGKSVEVLQVDNEFQNYV